MGEDCLSNGSNGRMGGGGGGGQHPLWATPGTC